MLDLSTQIENYNKYRAKLNAINYALYMISWDSETEAPVGCFENRSIQVGNLTEMALSIERSKEYIDTVNSLYQNKDNLDHFLKIEIEKVYKRLIKSLKVPDKEMIYYNVLLAKSQHIWAKAKQSNDYNLFVPVLKDIIDFKKKYIKYIETKELKGYNCLLDEYEEGMTTEIYDEFFNLLKDEIVPLVKKISDKPVPNDKFLYYGCDINLQKKVADYFENVMCFDRNRGLMKESEHPFTSGSGTTDVRITNHYYIDNFTSSIFSCIHEFGHAIFEQNVNPQFDNTILGQISMALHESQSRFYENIVGRSYSFWKKHFSILKETYKEQLKDISLDEFYRAICIVRPSLIRTEADELTYPLHIMVRYEIEKKIFNDEVSIDDLPKLWNSLYKEYLGVDVVTDKDGVLQDVHWACGDFGYFPTYALGSAYGAQFYYAMINDLDFDEAIGNNNLADINLWLKKHVHCYGASKSPEDILIDTTGEKFNPKYYVKYLKDRYKKIYKIS